MKTNHISTEEEINQLISLKTEEFIYLEFKSADALKNQDKEKDNISKDVSAFANSDGGTIIYGIIENNHVASELNFTDGDIFTKEWLEQVISSRIQRKIEGLIINPIRFESNIKKTVYVVIIPRSINAPHMASDKKFYKRTNFISKPMEEYEIRDLYTRQKRTILEIAIPKVIAYPGRSGGNNKIRNCVVTIDFEIENKGQTIEKYYKLEIRVQKSVREAIKKYRYDLVRGEFNKEYVKEEDGFFVYSVPNSCPIFQSEVAKVYTLKFNILKSNFVSIKKELIKLKLFYSSEVIEKEFYLNDNLKYKDRDLEKEDFIQ